jgi:uncharacterized short protein YbdD (DUF466 family)
MFGNLGEAKKYLGQAAKMLIGIPDYDNYVEHMKTNHPDKPYMTYTNSSASARKRATAEVEKAASAAAKGENMTPIAVTLLTGFLGAGKTTLLRHILNEQHGFKIAVIENEFGEVSVDDQLIGDRATQIKTLTNGCICCTRSNELEDALLDLLDSRDRGEIDFDRLVIECTGMADPGPIIQTFFSHEILCQRYLLDGVIALVDAVTPTSR